VWVLEQWVWCCHGKSRSPRRRNMRCWTMVQCSDCAMAGTATWRWSSGLERRQSNSRGFSTNGRGPIAGRWRQASLRPTHSPEGPARGATASNRSFVGGPTALRCRRECRSGDGANRWGLLIIRRSRGRRVKTKSHLFANIVALFHHPNRRIPDRSWRAYRLWRTAARAPLKANSQYAYTTGSWTIRPAEALSAEKVTRLRTRIANVLTKSASQRRVQTRFRPATSTNTSGGRFEKIEWNRSMVNAHTLLGIFSYSCTHSETHARTYCSTLKNPPLVQRCECRLPIKGSNS